MAPGFVVPGMTGLQAAAMPAPAFSAPPGADPVALASMRPPRSSLALCGLLGCCVLESISKPFACLPMSIRLGPLPPLRRASMWALSHHIANSQVCCAGMVAAPSQQATRHARRVYVGGLPPTATEQNVATFFSNALAAIGGTTAGPGARCCCFAGRFPALPEGFTCAWNSVLC